MQNKCETCTCCDDEVFGVFIDGDNVNPEMYSIVNDLIMNRGQIIMRRVYGDFTEPNMKSWKKVCIEYGIEAILTWRIKSKNSSDMKMISDISIILNTHPYLHNYVIVTGDIDLHDLCRLIISKKKYVIGISYYDSSTSNILKNSCNEFLVLEELFQLKPPIPRRVMSPGDLAKPDVVNLLIEIIAFEKSTKGINMGFLKKKILRFYPTFHERKYGQYKNFRQFIESCPEFTIQEHEKGNYYISTITHPLCKNDENVMKTT